jgi:hypothetical protein
MMLFWLHGKERSKVELVPGGAQTESILPISIAIIRSETTADQESADACSAEDQAELANASKLVMAEGRCIVEIGCFLRDVFCQLIDVMETEN